MDAIIKESLKSAMTYQEYRDLVAKLLSEGKSTGHIQTEAYFNYSKLGNARMRRLDKTFKLSESALKSIEESDRKQTWVVITEGWCGDAGHALPVINKIAEASKNTEVKIVLRDDNDALMNQFLTNGSKSIPKLIALNSQTNEVINTWGPRPSVATKMVNEYKEANGALDAEFKEELQVWYNKNKGVNIAEDLLQIMAS